MLPSLPSFNPFKSRASARPRQDASLRSIPCGVPEETTTRGRFSRWTSPTTTTSSSTSASSTSSSLAQAPDDGGAQQLQFLEYDNSQVEERNKAVAEIEKSINELSEMYADLSALVATQSEVLDRIDSNIDSAMTDVTKGTEELSRAGKGKKGKDKGFKKGKKAEKKEEKKAEQKEESKQEDFDSPAPPASSDGEGQPAGPPDSSPADPSADAPDAGGRDPNPEQVADKPKAPESASSGRDAVVAKGKEETRSEVVEVAEVAEVEVDVSTLPGKLEGVISAADPEGIVRPTILKPGATWTRSLRLSISSTFRPSLTCALVAGEWTAC